MRVIAISDIHMDFNDEYKLPSADLAVVAGDATYKGTEPELWSFFSWFSKQDAKHKLFVPGNHDIGCQKDPYLFKSMAKDFGIVLESNGFVYLDGKTLFCSAWTPYFYDWAFNGTDTLDGSTEKGNNLFSLWKTIIGENIDLLITHGPPRNVLSKNRKGEECGSHVLSSLLSLENVNVKNHIFGHIHHSHGQTVIGKTNYYNVSVLDDAYTMKHPPTQFEI